MPDNLSDSSETNVALCFIDRLPIETLETIFIHHARDCFDQCHHYIVPTAPDWVNVSYISWHWRNVALNCHSLWSCLLLTSPRWTEELLARSGQASLKVNLKLDYDANNEQRLDGSRFLEQVIPHLECIEEFRVNTFFMLTSRDILSKLSSPAPRLRVLDINRFWSGNLPLFLNGDTPVLETLELRSCSAAWCSLSLSRLTLLDISSGYHPSRQDMFGFLTAIGQMQNLESLRLRGALLGAEDFLSSTAFQTFQKIELPRLSLLDMSEAPPTTVAFLSCVHLPSKARVVLREVPLHSRYCSTFNSLIAQRFAMSEDHVLQIPPIRSLEFYFDEAGEVHVSFSTSERDYGSPHDILHLKIPFFGLMGWRDEHYVVGDILLTVPLSNVQILHICFEYSPKLAFCKDLLNYLPNLRYIKLSNIYIPGVSSILSVDPLRIAGNGRDHDEGNGSQDDILARALEEVELSGILIDYDMRVGSSPSPVARSEILSLCKALATRKGPRGRLTTNAPYGGQR